ncbi:ECF transporter S component [Anaerocolumna sp. AGMB13025]|uniref:ECF transporter S component n=1 Tax=Anaerocolumna sp. AGMB13025 TaxID=3039116 RepID=UPI00241CDE84|nr:ECF transporter S component [Anaerocolumna sp. AGMB13025]WFR58001.1 ECF transporter S component [Anaerocolumna sp. AGMB13025]
MNTNRNQHTLKLVQLGLFTAIILLMAFTPLGYIKTPGLEITLLVVPVTVGAILFGPTGGAILGGIFGLTSFIQCFGMSAFGAVLLNINPVGTFIVTVVSRILMGWLTGLSFHAFRKWSVTKGIPFAAASLAGPLLNTVLFMSTLMLFFYNTDYIQGIADALGTGNIFTFVIAFVGINGLIEAAVCFVLGTAIAKAVDVFTKRSGIQTR